jgi:hypothetical protein
MTDQLRSSPTRQGRGRRGERSCRPTVAEAIIPFVSRIASPLGLESALRRVVPRMPPQVTEGNRAVVVDNVGRQNHEADNYLPTSLTGSPPNGLRALRAGTVAVRLGGGRGAASGQRPGLHPAGHRDRPAKGGGVAAHARMP